MEFIHWLQESEQAQQDGLIEKSRDMGLTWLCAAYALHGWLFRPGFACGFGSRKLELVDKLGDPDTIFEKIRILRRSLPEWMLPSRFKEEEHDNLGRQINPNTGATITGEGGDEIGRGGRKTIYFVDEYAFLVHPDVVDRALSQNTRCIIRGSTPNGPGNPFYTRRFNGNTRVFSFHWKDDPRKNAYEVRDAGGQAVETGSGYAPAPPAGGRVVYPWYERETARLDDPVAIAQEIDIDYTASAEGIAIPAKWVRAAVNLQLPGDYEPHGPITAGFDVGGDGETADKNVVIAGQGPIIRWPKSWGGLNTTESAWKARDEARDEGVQTLFYDVVGIGEGVKGTWNTAEEPLGFVCVPVNSGQAPSERVWPDGKKSSEKFLNLKAEIWWITRERFRKAWEYAEFGIEHPADEMISIPNHPGLIADLSLPKVKTTATGKTAIESKQELRARGVKSPDHADALVLREAMPQKPAAKNPPANPIALASGSNYAPGRTPGRTPSAPSRGPSPWR